VGGDQAGLIREEEPPKPSTRLSSTATLPSLAAGRQTERARLTKMVRGELDWIVMQALEKDRGRRYETANGFARDIERYLAGEPVQAAPPSARYRLRKFAWKHRAALAVAAALLLALLLGIAGTTSGLLRAEAARADEARERALAQEKEHEAQREKENALKAARAEAAALDQTKRRLAQIEKGVDLLASMLAGINPRSEQKGGRSLYEQLRERASQAANQLDAESVGDAKAVARLQSILGDTLRELGDSARAIAVL
jgi:non-specific serine/threonine protein kinase/serine/threonine-protein kinase